MDAIAHDNYLLMIRVVTLLENLLAQQPVEEKIIFRRVCEQLIMHAPYQMAWIVSAETDGSIRPIAAEGIGSSALLRIGQRWDNESAGENPMAEYIHNQMLGHIKNETAEAFLSKEYGSDWKNFIRESKISAIFLEPIFINNRFVAALGICSRSQDSFKGDLERALLKLLARHLGNSISMLRNHHPIIKQKDIQQRLHEIVSCETLPGFLNQNLFKDRLALTIANARRNQQILAILLIDLDRCPGVNDALEHTAGDKLLHAVAKRLTKTVRGSDTVAQPEGKEFIVILHPLSMPEDAITVASKMLYELETPVVINEQKVFIPAAIGISFYPNDGETAEELMKNAARALSIAKESGQNDYRLYAAAMDSHCHERMALENDLRYALERNELMLFYQPQIELESGRVTGVEALLRWQHPTRGLIAAAEFISIAERSGLIIPIGNWILHEACNCMKRWQDAGAHQVSVAINLAARQFMQPNLPQLVAAALSKSGLLPHFLELELSENCLLISEFTNAAGGDTNASKHITASKDTAAMLQALKQTGVRIAIDNFGTGYSNLSHLRRFSIDRLKIDPSFVSNLGIDHSDRAVVQAILAAASGLGLTVIAQGVETADQLEFLSWEQCAIGQGYLFGKPMSALACSEFLEQSANDGLATQIRKRMCAVM